MGDGPTLHPRRLHAPAPRATVARMSHESKTRPALTASERSALIVKMLKSGLSPDDMRPAIEGEIRSCEADAYERGRLLGRKQMTAQANLGAYIDDPG